MIDRPTLHPHIPVQSKVRIVNCTDDMDGRTGMVLGVSSAGVVFFYIVGLDTPMFAPNLNETVFAISMIGSCLEVL